jgi:hypothetical protein
MHAHNVPEQLQKRVIKWFDYLWMEKTDLHDEDTFKWLPEKCKADILLYVNLDTLKKVKKSEFFIYRELKGTMPRISWLLNSLN